MPQILRSLVINQSQKLSIFFENQINMNDCSILMLFIFLPQIRIFRIKYIEKLEGVSVGGSARAVLVTVSLVTICIKFTGWWVHYCHYGAAATRRTHVTVVTSGDTWHVTRDVITRETRRQSPWTIQIWPLTLQCAVLYHKEDLDSENLRLVSCISTPLVLLATWPLNAK